MILTKISKYFLSLIALLSLVTSALARPDHIVLGYVPCQKDAVASPEDFNYDEFTHLARAFIREKDDGSLTIPSNYFNETFEKAARAHGVKILMSIGGGAVEADHWQQLAHNPQHVQAFFENVAKLLDEHQYDGIDIDWEPPPKNAQDGVEYGSFFKALRARFPKAIITVAMTGTKAGTAYIPYEEVIPSVDFINAMTYSYATPSSGLGTFNENLHDDPQGALTRHSVDEGMQNLLELKHIPQTKLLMGINFWACRYRVDHLGDKYPSHAKDKGYADNITYPQVQDLLTTGLYTALHDDVADAPYLLRKSGGCLITYDDPASIHDKCEDAKNRDVAGVIIWNTGADLGSGETLLMNEITKSFGLPVSPLSRPALEKEVARLGGKPVPSNASLDSLLKMEAELRAARGIADDAHWTAIAPAPVVK